MPVSAVPTTESDPAISCPKDGQTMTRLDADGVAVDRCPDCGGIWLDLGELRELLDRDPEAAPLITLLDRAERRVQRKNPPKTPDEWTCPRDGARLTSLRDPRQPHLEYELCSICGGVYFDAGELNDLSRQTLLERLRAILG
jgi:Zn-finger nucleic acid-binding protein